MKKLLSCSLAVIAMLCGASEAEASIVPVYSFENSLAAGPDGFFGLGATATQESLLGVTDGNNSLKYTAGSGGFVGVRTETLVPAALNNPPGIVRVLFDVTIVDAYAGTFADLGITMFGHMLNDTPQQFGLQHQFTDTVALAALGAGTHLDQEILLDAEFFSGQSFNQLYGPGTNQITVSSAFQFYVSKNAGIGFTFYIDNVRVDDGIADVPEAGTLSLFGLGAAVLVLFNKRRPQ